MESEIPKPSPSSEAVSVDPGLRETWMGRQERNEARQCLSYTKERWQQCHSSMADREAHEDCSEPRCFLKASFLLLSPWEGRMGGSQSQAGSFSIGQRTSSLWCVFFSLSSSCGLSQVFLQGSVAGCHCLWSPTCDQATPILRKLIWGPGLACVYGNKIFSHCRTSWPFIHPVNMYWTYFMCQMLRGYSNNKKWSLPSRSS